LSNHYRDLRRTFFKICSKLLLFLCWIQCEIASGQIHDPK
jgi:hypothetical protein